MATTVSLLALQDLYNEALVREQVDKTKVGTMTWTSSGTNTFASTVIDVDTYAFTVVKCVVGNVTDTYTLDVKKNGSAIFNIQSGVLSATDRDSAVKELYETVEIVVLDLDVNLKEVLGIIQAL